LSGFNNERLSDILIAVSVADNGIGAGPQIQFPHIKPAQLADFINGDIGEAVRFNGYPNRGSGILNKLLYRVI